MTSGRFPTKGALTVFKCNVGFAGDSKLRSNRMRFKADVQLTSKLIVICVQVQNCCSYHNGIVLKVSELSLKVKEVFPECGIIEA